jgi:sugar lactone lactonase YvrE
MLGIIALSILTGCATTAGLLGVGKKDKEQEIARCDADSDKKPLAKWSAISGILMERKLAAPGQPASQPQRLRLISPVAVAAQGNDIYIVDGAQKTILKYDRATQTIRKFISSPAIDMTSQIYLDRALSIYLTDTRNAQVQQYDIDGRLVQTYQNASELPQPGSVVVDDGRGEIFIADRLTARILVFDRGGLIIRAIGADVKENALRFQNIVALAMATNQLYVSDQLNKSVYALAPTGKLRYKFGNEELKQPGSVATDEFNRVYVADLADNTIKVYRGGELQTTVGEPRDPAKLNFQLISDLWISDGFLYVADAASASVEILRVVPPCL